jgi:hypothetical protein
MHRYYDDKANPPGSLFRSRFTEAEWRRHQREERRNELFVVAMVLAIFAVVAWGALEVLARIVSHGAHGISN